MRDALSNDACSHDLLNEAKSVFEVYPYPATEVRIISADGRKKVWRVTTEQGDYALKRSHYSLKKLLFSAYGHVHALSQGAQLPQVLFSQDGEPCFSHSGHVYVAHEWVHGAKSPDFTDRRQFNRSLKALALFHRTAKGYEPPVSCREKWSLGAGVADYLRLLTEVHRLADELRSVNHNRRDELASFLESSLDTVDDVIQRLQRNRLDHVLRRARRERYVNHGDFGMANVLLAGNRTYVIDLDGMEFGLPTRELAKALEKGTRRFGISAGILRECVGRYVKVNPLSPDEREVMSAEMLLPSRAYRTARRLVRGRRFSSREIDRTLQFEAEKVRVVRKLGSL